MIKVKVISAQIFERKINRKTDGKEFRFREQEAVVDIGPERRITVLSLADDQAAYPIGEYEVLPDSLDVDRDRRLVFKRKLALKPLVPSAGAPGEPPRAARLAGA